MESIGLHGPATYRAFQVNEFGRLGGLPEIIVAFDDGDAVRQVEAMVCPQPVEVWQGPRLVARVTGSPTHPVREDGGGTSCSGPSGVVIPLFIPS
jgi:hypothetical protein